MDLFANLLTASSATLLGFMLFLAADYLIGEFVRPEGQQRATNLLLVVLAPLAMVVHVHGAGGAVFDQRAAAIAIATAFGGLPVGAVAALAVAVIRVWQGGPAMIAGLLNAVAVYAACAAVVRWLMPGAPTVLPRFWSIVVLGLVSGGVAAASLLAVPPWPTGSALFHDFGPPLAAAQAVSICLFGWLLALQFDRRAGLRAREVVELSQAVHQHGLAHRQAEFMFRIATNGQILDVDDAYAARSGFSPAALRGMHIQDLRSDGQGIADLIDRVREAGIVTHEAVHRTRDGATWPVEITSVYDPIGNHVLGFVRDITERREAERLLAEKNLILKHALQRSIDAFFAAAQQRDPAMASHEERVRDLALRIARRLGFDEEQLEGLGLAALVHDIGAIKVPAEILMRPRRLRPEEFDIVRQHADAGYDILKGIAFPWPIADIVRQHHENIDGSGYPQGLSGEQICSEARILRVADSVESMMSHRPFRRAGTREFALAEIEAGAGRQFDPAVVAICRQMLRDENYAFPTRRQDLAA